MNDGGFFAAVYAAAGRIPRGKAATYGDIARAVGSPRAARAVGWALRASPESSGAPCWRVVNRLGGLAKSFGFGGAELQRQLLEAEGVEVNGGAVDLEKYRYNWK